MMDSHYGLPSDVSIGDGNDREPVHAWFQQGATNPEVNHWKGGISRIVHLRSMRLHLQGPTREDQLVECKERTK